MNSSRRQLLLLRIRLLKLAIQKKIERKIDQLEAGKRRKRKRVWTRNWILRRDELGCSSTLMKELATEEPEDYKNVLRMSETKFQELLHLVEPIIQRRDTTMRMALPAKVKLEITLRYLAGGETLAFLSKAFRVPVPSISLFLPEVLSAIKEVLSSYLQVSTQKI